MTDSLWSYLSSFFSNIHLLCVNLSLVVSIMESSSGFNVFIHIANRRVYIARVPMLCLTSCTDSETFLAGRMKFTSFLTAHNIIVPVTAFNTSMEQEIRLHSYPHMKIKISTNLSTKFLNIFLMLRQNLSRKLMHLTKRMGVCFHGAMLC